VRAVFFLLLFANLAFLAWAEWIDVPRPAPASDVYAKLPRLKLVGEVPGKESRPSSSSGRKTALQPAAQTSRCLSIGPFEDEPSVTLGASLLHGKGLTPRQRTEQGEVSKGFWVYIGNLKSDREVAQVLHTLEQGHVQDAQVMPDTGDARRVSLGLFSDRDHADRRAQSLRKLGLEPQVAERKLPGTVFWMDVDVPPGGTEPTPESFASTGASAHLQTTPCPAGRPQPQDAAPLPTPGTTTTFRTKVATGDGKVP
jgi:SPOR domain